MYFITNVIGIHKLMDKSSSLKKRVSKAFTIVPELLLGNPTVPHSGLTLSHLDLTLVK